MELFCFFQPQFDTEKLTITIGEAEDQWEEMPDGTQYPVLTGEALYEAWEAAGSPTMVLGVDDNAWPRFLQLADMFNKNVTWVQYSHPERSLYWNDSGRFVQFKLKDYRLIPTTCWYDQEADDLPF
jgi:hypothetical protein